MPQKVLSLSPLESDSEIKVMVNLLSDKGFCREWIDGIDNANALEVEIFKLIEKYGGTRDERLHIFHLIQIWGGFSGRNVYLNPQNGFDWNAIDLHYKNLIDECRKVKDHSEDSREKVLRAIKLFNKSVKHIGVPFITKHVRFWLYDHTGDRMLPIYDSVMSSKYMNQKTISYKGLKAYWDKMVVEAEGNGISLAECERRLYNRFRSSSNTVKK